MVGPDLQGKEEIMKFLGCSASDIVENFRKAESIISYVESQLMGRDYWQVSSSELAWLYSLVRIMKAERVAETGVGPGSTSLAILDAMKETGGKLFSFDKGVRYGNADHKSVGFLVQEQYRARWKLILGDSKETLEKNMGSYGLFDVFFHDSEHTYEHVTFELETALRHMKEKFLIVIDNYDWTSAPEEFSKKHNLSIIPVVDDMCVILPKISRNENKK